MINKKKQNRIFNNIGSRSNLFLYISIIILAVVVIFLSYRLLDKLHVFGTIDKPNEIVEGEKTIQVEILNGCGVDGIADKFTENLRKKNFDVVHTGNYRTFDIDESIVIERAGNMNNAKIFADVVGVDEMNIIEQINKDYFLDITLIVGKDYNQLFKNKD